MPGAAIEQELAGGESHVYRITLASGQYLRVVVGQRGIDVVLAVFGPDGQPLIEIDSVTSTLGSEFVSVLAEASGIYRLEVRAQEKEAPVGHYEAKIEKLREATPLDKSRTAAEKVSADRQRLRAQATAESLPRAIQKYEEALAHYNHSLPLRRAGGDRAGEAATLNNMGTL